MESKPGLVLSIICLLKICLALQDVGENIPNTTVDEPEHTKTTACFTSLTATPEKSTLATPGYPVDYTNVPKNCYWDITAEQPDGRVAILFEDLESTGCYYYDVEIFEAWNRITDVCDYRNRYRVLKSEGPNMRVKFSIGSYSGGKGFKSYYWSLNPPAPNCGYNITGDSGRISFDSLELEEEDPREELTWCQWIITTSEGSVVDLDIEKFQILEEYYFACGKLDINVYDGAVADNSTLLNGDRHYCLDSSKPLPYSDRFFTSTSNQMLVEFKIKKDKIRPGDYSDLSEGSSIQLEVSWPADKGDIQTLTNQSGVIQSPNYPGNYSGLAKDTYVIRARSLDSRIKVVIEDIDLEQCSDCSCDHVSIFNSGTVEVPIGRFCWDFEGKIKGAWFISDTNEVRIEFRTDESGSGRGFRITYETVSPDKIKDSNNATSTNRMQSILNRSLKLFSKF